VEDLWLGSDRYGSMLMFTGWMGVSVRQNVDLHDDSCCSRDQQTYESSPETSQSKTPRRKECKLQRTHLSFSIMTSAIRTHSSTPSLINFGPSGPICA
jgi:hypothetical protein